MENTRPLLVSDLVCGPTAQSAIIDFALWCVTGYTHRTVGEKLLRRQRRKVRRRIEPPSAIGKWPITMLLLAPISNQSWSHYVDKAFHLVSLHLIQSLWGQSKRSRLLLQAEHQHAYLQPKLHPAARMISTAAKRACSKRFIKLGPSRTYVPTI